MRTINDMTNIDERDITAINERATENGITEMNNDNIVNGTHGIYSDNLPVGV